jgi:DNA-binding PadR family transcriptional regulator
MTTPLKEKEDKKAQNLLDFILLQSLDTEPMREQQLVFHIREAFGVYIKHDTLNCILVALKNQGFVESKPNIDVDEPPILYRLTAEGRNMLTYAENALISTCKHL